MAIISCAIQCILGAYLFYTYQYVSLNPIPLTSPFLSPLVTTGLSSISGSLFLFCIYIHLYYFYIPQISDYHHLHFSLPDFNSLSVIFCRSIHFAADVKISFFFLWPSNGLCVCVCVCVCVCLCVYIYIFFSNNHSYRYEMISCGFDLHFPNDSDIDVDSDSLPIFFIIYIYIYVYIYLLLSCICSFFFFFWSFFLGPHPWHMARGLIGAVAASLRQRHSNVGSEPHL